MEPEISVVILSCNHWNHTQRLLESLTHTRCCEFETILIDNGSTPDAVAALKAFAATEQGPRLHLRCILNDTNRGIASGRNQGASLARGRWLLFLDNDLEVIDSEWLSHLLATALQESKAGAIGAVLLNPDHTIQFAGGDIQTSGRTHFWNVPRPIEIGADVGATMYALGACLLTPSGVWNKLCGFDQQFDPMDFEDIDYCLRAAAAGHPSYVALSAKVLHHGHVTTGREPSLARMQILIRSGRRFLRRWGEFLSELNGRDTHFNL
jgi:GT2 family glycosyltransferase